MHRCGKKTASGEDCSSTFTKPGNLKRHVRDIHQNRSTIFIDCNPGARRRRTRHPVAERPSPPLRDTTCVSSLPSPPTLAPSVGAKGDRMLQPGTLEGTFADSMPLQVDDSAWNNRIDHLASEFEPENALGGDIAFDGADEHPQEVHEVEPETQGMNGPGSTRKRRRSSSSDSYIYLGTSRDVMPVYEVKQSKKTPGQQRGLQWLTVSARDQFRSAHDALLGAWGVTSEHTGTCVLCPEDWRFSDPLKLMDLFGKQNRPSPRLPRAWYSHSDHATTMSRAVAWFSSWPRTGGELDNFLGAGPYKPMHGSHLCHHDHCIIHLTYERGDINEDRKICCRRARFLRQERRDVPEHCRRHKPPCLMQHAALTTLEAYHLQFAVLRQAKGLPATPALPRPRRYIYPTFETQLPGRFHAVAFNPIHLISEAPPVKSPGRPDLTCKFCLPTLINSYATISGLWTHLVVKHPADDTMERLEEIKRTGSLWQAYWEVQSDGGKRGTNTPARLTQTQQSGFCWNDVLSWGLGS